MKMRLQAQAAQETMPKSSIEFSVDDIEVAHSFLTTVHANLQQPGDEPLHQWVGIGHQVCQDDRPFSNTEVYLSRGVRCALADAGFLRSGKTKITKSSNEAEYRAIFDNFISDLLAVLFWPEWPAAALLLGIIGKVMVDCFIVPLGLALILLEVGSLDDVKTNQSDTGAARSMALDHLGVIASRLRSTSLKFSSGSSTKGDDGARALKPVEEVCTHFSLG